MTARQPTARPDPRAAPAGAHRPRGARSPWLAPLAAVALLAGCGTATGPAGGPGDTAGTAGPDGPDGPDGADGPVSDGGGAGSSGADGGGSLPDWSAQDPDLVLTGHGLVLQQQGEPAQLCVGGVAESYPPQCGGPELVGFDWQDAPEHESAAGVTWGYATVVGTLDGGRFHLTDPVTQQPPEGWGEPGGTDFPELCDDPLRGGDPDWGQDRAAAAAADELGRAVQSLDGYVTMWVSDGRDHYNVVVTGDPEAAHDRLREVWPGWLCVEQRDLPTQRQLRAAQDELATVGEDLGVLSSGSGGTDGLLHVGVLVADRATVAAVRETVDPHLSAEHVVVEGALRPVTEER